jgi:RHS repeat-associated protein
MRKFFRLWNGVALHPLATVVFIGFCCQGYGETCSYQNPPGHPGPITSISPSTWYAGQTIQVTITGNFPGGDQPGCELNESDAVGQTTDPQNFFFGVGIYPGVTIELDPNDPDYDAGTFTPTQVTLTVQVAANAPSGTAYIGLFCDGCDVFTVGGPVQIIGLSKNIGNPCNIPGSNGTGDPISICSGDVFEQVTDYETAGQNKLSYIRYYNSLSVAGTYAVDLGTNWRSNYDRYLQLISSSLITAERPDGQEINFYNNGSGWTSDSDVDYTLTQTGSTWTLTDHDDSTEVYDGTFGFLQSIKLRNGYAQTMTYNPTNQLINVTDSYNRQLTFTYSNGTVSTVTTPDGLVLTYGYNSVINPNDQLASVSYSTSPVTSQQYLYQNASLPYALTSILDENGTTFKSWTYDGLGRGLTSQTGGGANLYTVSFNDTNNTRTVTNALGVTDSYTLIYLQNDYKISNVSRAATSTTAAATETFSFDSNGYISSETDWNGNQTTYVNDNHGDPTTIDEAVGSSVARTTTIAYDPTFVQLPDTITTPGLTTAFSYDGSGEVLTKTLTDTTAQSTPYSTNGSTREWQYTWQNSLLATVQSPRTDVVEKTTYTYDSTGALTGITNPLNQQTTISSHTGGGLPLTIVDPNGVTTNLTYDPRQHLLTRTVVTSGGNRTTTYGYDAAEDLTSVTLPDGSGLSYTYDTAHRLTAITDLLGEKVSYTLDALGDHTATNIRNASGTVTSQHSDTFDALGRMLEDIGASNQTSSFTYDAMGNVVTATDQASNTTQRAFDALNRLYQITDPASGITTTSYDAHDRPLSVTSPNGVATADVYDGFGGVIQENNPNTGAAVYYYDTTGNRTKRVAATGAVTQYTYDALDRVLTMTFPADSAENVAYTYDQSGHGAGIGRLTSVSDAAGTLSRSYDQLGNLLTDARTTSMAGLTTAYTYDPANRIASITYPSGTAVTYTRDTMGRITSASVQPSGGTSTPVASSVAYEPFGPDTGFRYGSGSSETRGFDQDYRLTNVTDLGAVRRGLARVLENLSYAYYPTNNVQTITDAVTSSNSQSFSYDNLQRLSQAAGSNGTFGFTYDGDGNQLTQTLGATTTNYGYGSGSDQLATISVGGVATQAIGYTADGRIASLNPGIQAPAGQYITSLSYNQNAQLSAVNAESGALASYTYDGFGQRLIKTVSASYGEIYQYGQNGMLLEETNASGVAQADYIYLNGRPVAVLNGSTFYYLHDDRLGTPQVASDSSQNTQWEASYEPFGQTTSVSGTITQNLRFPGQYFDVESGWNHNGLRDYAPELGRYIEPDPLGRLGSGNDLYAYVGDNPTNFFDPLGLCAAMNSAQRNCAEGLQDAGKTMAAVDRANAMWDTIQSAADANNIDPALLAAVGIEETGFNNVWQGCTTDANCATADGAGIWQVDLGPRGGNPNVSVQQAFDPAWAANYAANKLSNNMNALAASFPYFTADQLTQATAASYNIGVSQIWGNPATIDVGTQPNGNYGATVLALMDCF